MNTSKNSFRHSPSVQKEAKSYFKDQSHKKTMKKDNNVSDFKTTNRLVIKNSSDSENENDSEFGSDFNQTRSALSPKFELSRQDRW
jgi:hypothetical protein